MSKATKEEMLKAMGRSSAYANDPRYEACPECKGEGQRDVYPDRMAVPGWTATAVRMRLWISRGLPDPRAPFNI